jgi:3D (Asp-Asp-Asp) domain-containing protein
MQTPTSVAVMPRVLRRNRMLLGAFVVAMAPIVALATGLLDRTPHPGPLLLAVDEMSLPATTNSMPRSPITHSLHAGMIIPPVLEPDTAATPTQASAAGHDNSHPQIRWFNGRQIRPLKTLTMIVTAYSPDERSCGENADGITASGFSVWTNGMKLVAADTELLPLGSIITVPGYDSGAVVPVLDRGGAIKGRRLDVLFPTHEQARAWGRQTLEVTVWDYVDGRPSDFVPLYHRQASVAAHR